MKKFFKIIIFSLLLIISLSAFAGNTTNINVEYIGTESNLKNDYLEESGVYGSGNFVKTTTLGEKGILNLMLNIARDARIIVYGIVLFLVVLMALRLFIADNSEEQAKKLKMGILWSTIGIMIMQIAFVIRTTIFDKGINEKLGKSIVDTLINPFQNLLTAIASFIFIVAGIIAFYKIVTAGGSDDKVKEGKMTIVYSIMGFIVIKFSDILVKNTYNPSCNNDDTLNIGGLKVCGNATKNAEIITKLLAWVNGFVFLFVLLMTVYSGFLILTSNGDEEKQKKAKNTIVYIAIGVTILFASFLILKFFINKE